MFGYGECGWARPEFVVDDATPVRGKVVVLDELGGHPVQQRSGERGVDPRPVRLDVGAQLGQFVRRLECVPDRMLDEPR